MAIEFVIPTHKRPEFLMCSINSIMVQTNPNWFIHVITDHIDDAYLKIKDFYKDNTKIKFSEKEFEINLWGHAARNYGIAEAKEEWLVMTGDDNYYTPNFVESFLKNVTDETIFVWCDMIHNAFSYKYVNSRPVVDRIDIGNFMIRTKNAKQMSLNVINPKADGVFAEEYLKKFTGKAIYIQSALYVHN